MEYVVERQQEIEKEKRMEENEVLQEFRVSFPYENTSTASTYPSWNVTSLLTF